MEFLFLKNEVMFLFLSENKKNNLFFYQYVNKSFIKKAVYSVMVENKQT